MDFQQTYNSVLIFLLLIGLVTGIVLAVRSNTSSSTPTPPPTPSVYTYTLLGSYCVDQPGVTPKYTAYSADATIKNGTTFYNDLALTNPFDFGVLSQDYCELTQFVVFLGNTSGVVNNVRQCT